MARSYASNPGSTERRNISARNTPEKTRRQEIDSKLKEQGTKVRAYDYATNAPDLGASTSASPNSIRHIAARQGAVSGLGRTTVPVSHLNGLQFLDVQKGKTAYGSYEGNAREMALRPRGSYAEDPVASRARETRTAAHEVGHHVEAMTHGQVSYPPYAEALAENYADRHTPYRDVKAPEGSARQRARSTYDSKPRTFEAYKPSPEHVYGDEHGHGPGPEVYKAARKSRAMPDDPRPAVIPTESQYWNKQ